MGLNPWFIRLVVILAIISIHHASPNLALVLVAGAGVVVAAMFLYHGRYLPRSIMDVLDRLTDRTALADAYERKSNELVAIDATALSERIRAKVIGQDDAVDAIATQLRRRIAARRKDKPIAVFCLAGAPGVGKTHFAKVLANELYGSRNHLHFFDMSQFGQPHSAASLFGQARGYVGSHSYGALTAALRDVPNAVVLLDEFEKAHPEVHKRFLTAWNDGFVTEVSDGARVPTNEAIFILTTNAASRRIAEVAEEKSASYDDVSRLAKSALADAQFAPEVLSRVDEVFAFRALKGLDIARVVALEIEMLAAQFGLKIADGGIDPSILMDAIELLSGKSQGGVRDMTRAIERQVSDGFIEARSAGAKEIRISRNDGRIVVQQMGTLRIEPQAHQVLT